MMNISIVSINLNLTLKKYICLSRRNQCKVLFYIFAISLFSQVYVVKYHHKIVISELK